MQKKLIAVAVAGVLAAPLALAQTNVTISGTMNAGFENIQASGGTIASTPAQAGSLASRTRIVDNSSELRFSVTEDLGGGLSAFGTIGSSVDMGYTNVPAPSGANTLGSRNTGVGLRSKTWGEILMGRWDVQWHTLGGVDSFWIKSAGSHGVAGSSMTNGRGISRGFGGTQGTRLDNQIRYVSPTWNGFNVIATYGRPVEALAATTLTTGSPNRNARDTTWSLNPTYNNGPWHVAYGYYARNNQNIGATALAAYIAASPIIGGAAGIAGLNGTLDTRGHRAGLAYTFAMGLKLGIFWDRLRVHETSDLAADGTGSMSRTAWGIPVSYTTGAHAFGVSYARAGAINASASVAATNAAVKLGDNNTGAHMWSLGYQYSLSKRTNLWLNYAKISNSSRAGYDFGSNAGIGMSGLSSLGANTAAGNAGADPRTWGMGVRHTF